MRYLVVACAIFGVILWIARRLKATRPSFEQTGRVMATGLVVIAFIQIAFGGLVAGLDAGFVYNIWPLFNGDLVPGDLFPMDGTWWSLFEDQLLVQGIHRLVGYLLFGVALIHLVHVKNNSYDGGHITGAWMVFGAVCLQVMIGIVTVLTVTPIYLVILHQAGALLVLGVMGSPSGRLLLKNHKVTKVMSVIAS